MEVEGIDGYTNSRMIRKGYIKNSFFKVEDAGKGLGTEILARQIQNASDMGFKKLQTYATRDEHLKYNGHYTWPRLGFDSAINWREISREGMSAASEEIKGAEFISDLMKTKAGRDWWKEHGASHMAEFNLDPKSQSMRVFRDYLAEKGML